MSLTITDILDNTDQIDLKRLFKEYTLRLVENTRNLGIFSVENDQPVFSYTDRETVVKQMISDRTNLEEFD